MAAAAVLLALLYAFALPFLQSEKIPDSPLPILAIGGFYVLLSFLFRMSPPDKVSEDKTGAPVDLLSSREFFEFCLLLLLLTTLLCVMPIVGQPVVIILNLALFAAGPFIFVIMIARLLMTRH